MIIFIYLISAAVYANAKSEHKHLPYKLSLSLLEDIDQDSIHFGNGKKIIYVFIDPLCPYSRKFITMVSKNAKMLSKYQYRIFLYSIPRLNSTEVISAVYMSPNPIETLLQIMIEDDVVYSQGNQTTQDKIRRIEKVAQEIDVYKRPYIFIVK